jgi:hypothetical protein
VAVALAVGNHSLPSAARAAATYLGEVGRILGF